MTDIEVWENFLSSYNVEFDKTYRNGSIRFDGKPTIELVVGGVHCNAEMVFDATTKKFMYMSAHE